MEQKKTSLNVEKNRDPNVQIALDHVMTFLAGTGIMPVIIVGRLPDGSTVDMHNRAVCGKCLAERLEQIAKIYHENFPEHSPEDKPKQTGPAVN